MDYPSFASCKTLDDIHNQIDAEYPELDFNDRLVYTLEIMTEVGIEFPPLVDLLKRMQLELLMQRPQGAVKSRLIKICIQLDIAIQEAR